MGWWCPECKGTGACERCLGTGIRGFWVRAVVGLGVLASVTGRATAMVLAGASETLYGYTPTYGAWLVLHFPVLGLLKAAVITAAVLWLFPDRIERTGDDAPAALAPATGQSRVMALLLVSGAGYGFWRFRVDGGRAFISLLIWGGIIIAIMWAYEAFN